MPFRPLEADDLNGLIAIQEEGAVASLSHIFPQDRYPFQREIILDRWRQELGDPAIAAYASCDADGTLTGFAATHLNEFLHFGIAMERWGSGLAAEFHDHVLDELRRTRTDIQDDFFWLRVFEENHRARRFYEKLGWVPTGNRSRSTFEPRPFLVEYRCGR